MDSIKSILLGMGILSSVFIVIYAFILYPVLASIVAGLIISAIILTVCYGIGDHIRHPERYPYIIDGY